MLCLTLGAVVLLFTAYETWGKPAQVEQEQRQLDQELSRTWGEGGTAGRTQPGADPGPPVVGDGGPVTAREGSPFARLSIPRLGLHWTVVEGVTLRDLRAGPGHYPNTQGPGDVGNFAVAGHRVRGTFWDLDELTGGDVIVVETATQWYTYRVDVTAIVKPRDTAVIAPDPDHPGEQPTRRLLTLTTCNPKWGNRERLVVHAQLAGTQPKAAGTTAGVIS